MSTSHDIPHGVSATGVQRALGERRQRRLRERGGRIDLDATMSSWGTPEPPVRPRSVVRPRRSMPGAPTQPFLPTPQGLAVRHLVPAATPVTDVTDTGPTRRSRRAARETGSMPAVPGPGPTSSGAVDRGDPRPAADPRDGGSPGARPGGGPGAVDASAHDATGHAGPVLTPAMTTRARSPFGPPGAVSPSVPVADPEPPPSGGGSVAVGTRRRAAAAPEAPALAAPAPVQASPAGPVGQASPAGTPVARSAGPDPDPFSGFTRSAPGARQDPPPATPQPAKGRFAGRTPAGSTQAPEAPPLPPAPRIRQRVRLQPDPAALPPALDEPDIRERRPPVPLPAAVVAVLAALVALVVALVLVFRNGDTGGAAASLVVSDAPEQQTVLVTLTAEDGSIARAALVAVGATAEPDNVVVPILVPQALTLNVPDGGALPLSAATTVDADAADRGVEDALGVRVDGIWAMDGALLSDYVDSAGGIDVDVTTAVTDGAVTVPFGPDQKLTGAQARVYAEESADGDAADASLQRFGQVVVAMLRAVPPDVTQVTQWLSGAERNPGTTITSEDLTTLLAEASQRLSQGVPADPLVVPTIASSDGSLLTVDEDAVATIVESRLPGAALPMNTVGKVDVLVGDTVGRAGLITAARDRLVASGLRYAAGGPLEVEDPSKTYVLVPQDTPEDRDRAQAVIAALGVRAELNVKKAFDTDVPEGTDIIVWLGQDFADSAAEEAP